MTSKYQVAATLWLGLLSAALLPADEGMWLFNNFPAKTVQAKYGFRVTQPFLDHLRLGAVRFNNGGTGSFVSPSGLLFTNHHVGADCIQKLGSGQKDYLKLGYLARTAAEEAACPDLEVNVLLRIEDVTLKVTAGITPQTPAAEANQMKKAAMSSLEKQCNASSGNRCDVVTLYSGGSYHLYEYKKYTDIRLVMAPEFGVAFFGGDPENFTYPRYNLDICFFRAYENGKPAQIKDFFRWSKDGVKEGELVFVPGNPGSTGRLMTMTELEFSRDVAMPVGLRRMEGLIRTLQNFGSRGQEQKRIAAEELFGEQNSFKAYSGFIRGLRDQALMNQKRADERKLKDLIAKDPAQAEKFGKFWDELATTYQNYRGIYNQLYLLERTATRGCDLLEIARDIVRYTEEVKKPNGDRCESTLIPPCRRLSRGSTRPLRSTRPFRLKCLPSTSASSRRNWAPDHPVLKTILGGRSAAEAARFYVESSKLIDVAERKRLAADPAAVKSSQDGMIRLALMLDQPARELRKRYEDQIESVVTRAASQIAQARFKVFGGNEYPDATFTMRLAYGDVRGYVNDAGKPVPYATDFAGFYLKGKNEEPYIIPPAWLKSKDSLNLKTQFNFVTTADTHGGNSGSATLNTKGEVVGILFDGNLEGLPNRFVFTDRQARSVHVSSAGIVEALRVVYQATGLLKELGVH